MRHAREHGTQSSLNARPKRGDYICVVALTSLFLADLKLAFGPLAPNSLHSANFIIYVEGSFFFKSPPIDVGVGYAHRFPRGDFGGGDHRTIQKEPCVKNLGSRCPFKCNAEGELCFYTRFRALVNAFFSFFSREVKNRVAFFV